MSILLRTELSLSSSKINLSSTTNSDSLCCILYSDFIVRLSSGYRVRLKFNDLPTQLLADCSVAF
jgi:hypothetical protein